MCVCGPVCYSHPIMEIFVLLLSLLLCRRWVVSYTDHEQQVCVCVRAGGGGGGRTVGESKCVALL